MPSDLTVGDFERDRQSMDFAQEANAEVDLAGVPDELRHLAWSGAEPIPAIEYWQENQPEFVAEFCQAVEPFADAIYAWNREAVARENFSSQSLHLYPALVATYEMVKPLDQDLIARNQKKTDDMLRAGKRKSDLDNSVECLPHEASLTPAETKRLELAKKRQ